jgi:osmotically-inducible protein OsmY
MTPDRAEERYLPEHLHEALLADSRVGEQDLRVTAEGHCIHITGTVPTQSRRDAIVTVVTELAPGWQICNDVEVVEVAPGPDVEDVT